MGIIRSVDLCKEPGIRQQKCAQCSRQLTAPVRTGSHRYCGHALDRRRSIRRGVVHINFTVVRAHRALICRPWVIAIFHRLDESNKSLPILFALAHGQADCANTASASQNQRQCSTTRRDRLTIQVVIDRLAVSFSTIFVGESDQSGPDLTQKKISHWNSEASLV